MAKLSFTAFAKQQIAAAFPQKDCCRKAWLAAAVKATASIKVDKSGYCLVFESEDLNYLRTIVDVVKYFYRTDVEIAAAKNKGIKKGYGYTLRIQKGLTSRLLEDCSVFKNTEDGYIINEAVDASVIRGECCRRNFLKSLFLATGNANVPSKIMGSEEKLQSGGTGYYLEFLLSDELLASFTIDIFATFGITARMSERAGKFVVYLKDSENISKAFALMDAAETVLYIEEIIVERIFNNNLNRQNNCKTANTDKIVTAAANQVVAINRIQERQGLDSLPDKLKELACLRLQNPMASLDFFTERLGISKSGINHRFRKIMAIASQEEGADGDLTNE